MKFLSAALVIITAASSTNAFSTTAPAPMPQTNTDASGAQIDPLLIRAARGEKTDRVPVWMMRQAGRHIKEYRDLCKKYPTFRERSEIPDVAVEVSLQPWRNYQTDGCILFSDKFGFYWSFLNSIIDNVYTKEMLILNGWDYLVM